LPKGSLQSKDYFPGVGCEAAGVLAGAATAAGPGASASAIELFKTLAMESWNTFALAYIASLSSAAGPHELLKTITAIKAIKKLIFFINLLLFKGFRHLHAVKQK
jgi:hypothetical protein